ncbi:hypothetical protein HX13_17800 [Chryseobacterium sp. P1-3]|nr:hypothetical protein HX13_17800 [Chryseobacterium sp. P1-3]
MLLIFSCKERKTKISTNIKLLQTLDEKIKEKKNYENNKKKSIKKLKNELLNTTNDSIIYSINHQIVEYYLGYQCDSAYAYSDKNKEIAIRNNNKQWLYKNLFQRSVLLSTTGLFVESKEILDDIDPQNIPKDLHFPYNSAYECLYSNLIDYTGDDNIYGQKYREKLAIYYHSAYISMKENDPLYYLFLSHKNRINGNWNVANENIDKFLNVTKPGTRLHAIGSFCKAVIEQKTREHIFSGKISYLLCNFGYRIFYQREQIFAGASNCIIPTR